MFIILPLHIILIFAVNYYMKKIHLRAVAIVACAAAIIVAAAIIAAIPFCGSTIEFSARYFFVCYKSADDAHYVDSISSIVQSYGGAGYIAKIGSEYYITVACYYEQEDAQGVQESLSQSGLNCRVIETYAGGYEIPAALRTEKNNIMGALTALDQLGNIFYQMANGLDGGGLSQSAASSVIDDAYVMLGGLQSYSFGQNFADEIAYLRTLVGDVGGGNIYARDMRALQIAVCDCLLNLSFV